MQQDIFGSILAYVLGAFVLGTTSGALLRAAAGRLGRGLVLTVGAPVTARSGEPVTIDVSIRNYALRKPKEPRRLVVVLESPSFNPPQALRALEEPSGEFKTSFAVTTPDVNEATLLATKVKLLASGGLVALRTRDISVRPRQRT